MTKITATKMVKEEVEFDVDDRIYDEDSMAWKIANIILDGRLETNIKNLYVEDYGAVSYTVEKINSAFDMADKILEL